VRLEHPASTLPITCHKSSSHEGIRKSDGSRVPCQHPKAWESRPCKLPRQQAGSPAGRRPHYQVLSCFQEVLLPLCPFLPPPTPAHTAIATDCRTRTCTQHWLKRAATSTAQLRLAPPSACAADLSFPESHSLLEAEGVALPLHVHSCSDHHWDSVPLSATWTYRKFHAIGREKCTAHLSVNRDIAEH
jgi:hypothetical protein